MKPCLVYVISLVHQSNLFLWTAEALARSEKYRLVFILLHRDETSFEKQLRSLGITVHRIPYSGKKEGFQAFRRIRKILRREKADMVHTHLFDAGLFGQAAARFAGIKKRIHTRHDATIHHRYHPHAVKYDKITNRFATHLIAITENVRKILTEKEHVPAQKISTIHHGFHFEPMLKTSDEKIKQLEQKYFPEGKPEFVVGAVSRFIEWKGVQFLVPAFERFRKENPGAHLVLANAGGPYSGVIEKQLSRLPAASYTLINFETEIFSLFRLFDLFVHLPVDEEAEAFGQVYIEAMACGIPSVITLSGVASEFVKNGVNAIVVKHKDSESVYLALNKMKNNPELRMQISRNAREIVLKRFDISGMMQQLEKLYDG